MFKRVVSVGILCLTALARPGFSAVNTVEGLANPLDNTGVSARAVGMGSAFVGVADDSSALFWNPAGLGGLKDVEIALHHNSWLAGIVQETGVVALPTRKLGVFGVSGNYVNYGSLEGYDSNGTQLADYSANRYGFGLGWGKELFEGWSAGVAVKGSMQTIDTASYSSLSADLGALWSPEKHTRLGAAYSNFGTQVAGYGTASAIRLGGSYLLDFAKSNQLLLAAGASIEPGGVNRLQVGAEDMMFSFLALRVGYQSNLAETKIQGLTGLTAGLGVRFDGFGLDYAYLPYGDLDNTHRVSLSYQFGQEKKPDTASDRSK
jgi:hypothetical protein